MRSSPGRRLLNARHSQRKGLSRNLAWQPAPPRPWRQQTETDPSFPGNAQSRTISGHHPPGEARPGRRLEEPGRGAWFSWVASFLTDNIRGAAVRISLFSGRGEPTGDFQFAAHLSRIGWV